MSKTKLMTSVAGVACAVAIHAGDAAAQNFVPLPPANDNSDANNALQPFYGDISPFYGDISPFYGDISPFWGDIAPFWGDISPFYGDISPFWGDISPFYGDIAPFYGDIAPFWGDIAPFMEELRAHWGDISPFEENLLQQDLLRSDFEDLISRSEAFWGAAVQAQSGQSFREGFVADLFAKYSLDLDDPSSFQGFSDADRARFLFDWYDGLMAFSGRDHVDHWMATVRWNPALTQVQQGNGGTVIGLLDAVGGDADVTDNMIDEPWWVWTGDPSTATVGGHGAAVASLLVADHDGRGVMGIAPRASVALYNPYDETGTTNWDSVAEGVRVVTGSGASVVNLSLGVPGSAFHPDWYAFYNRPLMQSIVRNDGAAIAQTFGLPQTTYKPVFVHAAGNEGVAQTANVNWNFTLNPSFIVVGSVGPSGVISPFSNTPGNACLMNNGLCQERLMNRFIVAPGEWILTSDGEGGVTRQSGTSFAAPLVTGAVALLHSRWPWLRNYSRESADIILGSARDLGAPGTDPVYGRGLLDITASQSPLSLAALYQRTADGQRVSLTSSDGSATLLGAENGYVVVYEDIGATYRDFIVPLDASLSSTSRVTSQLQTYLTGLLSGMGTTTTTSTSTGTGSLKKKKRFSDEFSAQVANPFGLDMRMALSPLPLGQVARDGELPYAVDMTLAGDGVTLFAGRGAGAVTLAGASSFDAASYAVEMGGANPILGLASGGGYVAAETQIGAGFSLSAGFTSREHQAVEADPFTGEERPVFEGFAPYRSAAAHALLRKTMGEGFAVSASYTFLREDNGLLGLQSVNSETFAAGNETDAASFGVEWAANARVSLAASATLGRTRAQDSGAQTFAVSDEGVRSSAYEVALNVSGVFGEADVARLRFAQPLHVDGGGLNVTNVEVVDRETGAFGLVTQHVQLGGAGRQYFLEGLYATPVFDGQGEFGAFARVDISESGAQPVEEMVGARLRLSF